MEALLNILETKLKIAKFYKKCCNDEESQDYIEEAEQVFKQIIEEIKAGN